MGTTKSIIFISFAILAMVGASIRPGHAASLIIDGAGQLRGASNVDVGGSLYNVTFVDGTCVSVYGGCVASNFDFTDEGKARSASNALLGQVFLDIPGIGQFDSNPAATFGVIDPLMALIMTPYSIAGSSFSFVSAFNMAAGLGSDLAASGTLGSTIDTFSTTGPSFVFADWNSAAVSAVPLPPSAFLFGTALLGLAGLRRRRGGPR